MHTAEVLLYLGTLERLVHVFKISTYSCRKCDQQYCIVYDTKKGSQGNRGQEAT